MKHKTLHMIGNAHIDPVWLWQWQEGFHEVKASWRSALDRMNEYDDFIFTSSSAAYYEWVEHNEPQMFAEIQRRVAEGRWVLVGGWWVQPDCNIPCGESFVRQGLIGQRYFKEKFGVTATVGYCVDSFGHHAMLPQILKKSGLDTYVFLRPMPHEKGLPSRLFWWESDDGSRVLAFRIPFEYLTWGKAVEQHVRRCAAEFKAPFTDMMCFYGVGNHGGGPTRENIESIRALAANPDFPKLNFSSPNQFFERVSNQDLPIPTVHDDLQHHASGCYAAHSGVKQWNRRAENLLLAAEKFSSIAAWTTGQPYPSELNRAWKDVLFNQFHDILAGTSIEPAYDDARDEFGAAMTIAKRALNNAVQSLAWNVRTSDTKPIVVFNPHAWQSKISVELEYGRVSDSEVLMDDESNIVPLQLVQSLATAGGRYRLSFVADLPPLGYRTYHLATATPSPAPVSQERAQGRAVDSLPCEAVEGWAGGWIASDALLENADWRLEIDRATGHIKSLRDKKQNLEVFLGDAAKPVVLDDPSDTWSHNVFKFDRVSGAFMAQSVKLIEHGPVKATIRVVSVYGASQLMQDFTLYAELAQIDVRVTVDWRERFKLLKLRFPLNLNFMQATYEIPYGHIVREANGEEEPGQHWLDVTGVSRDSGERYGLSILNDGKYSFDVNIRDIGLTVLRSPIYAHHDPLVPQSDGQYSFIDQGIQYFTYTLLPHVGGWEQAGTVRRAAELNQRPITLIGSPHPNATLPQQLSFASVEPDNIVLTTLKRAEDNDDLIVRAYETHGAATRAIIQLPQWQRVIEADFRACEIKTFRVPRDAERPIVETNLLEWTE